MTVQEQIDAYVAGLDPSRGEALRTLNRLVLDAAPDCRLWFLDGKDATGKIVSNPNIGYGRQTIEYASGETKDFYRIGLSANTAGLSVYVLGLADKTHLAQTYGPRLGKAKVTGYCVKFRSVKDIDLGVLKEMIAAHMGKG